MAGEPGANFAGSDSTGSLTPVSDRGGGSPTPHADEEGKREHPPQSRSDEGATDSAASATARVRHRALDTAAHSSTTAEDADSTTGIANSVGGDAAP
jgi:hypothetical protein